MADLAEARLTPLTGGVASDIWKVEMGPRVFVVKKALAQLRVAQTWLAPVSRNASDVDWLFEARRIVPEAGPEILASDREAGIFRHDLCRPGRSSGVEAQIARRRCSRDHSLSPHGKPIWRLS